MNFVIHDPVNERDAGANVTFGFVTNFHQLGLFNETFVRFNVGIDSIRYEHRPIAAITGGRDRAQANVAYQSILDKLFCPGEYVWLTLNLGQDTKNHPMHPSQRPHMVIPRTTCCSKLW